MAMSLYLTVTETLAPLGSDPGRCPTATNAMAIGMLGGSGVMNVATGPGPKVVSIPVIFGGSDCPTAEFQFSYGNFTLSTPNGHQMHVNYYGGFNPTSQTTLAIDSGRSGFAITGGTGFLAGASGTGTLAGNENILSQPPAFLGLGSIQANGTITFSNPGFAQRFMNGQ